MPEKKFIGSGEDVPLSDEELNLLIEEELEEEDEMACC
jgi:hypothetical protein